MTTLLAKILHPASTSTSRDPEGEAGATGSRKAGKPQRRRLLAALAMPPVIATLALLGAGAASANDDALVSDQVTFDVGGLTYTGGWSADIACNSQQHSVTFSANITPAWDYEPVYIRFWLYSGQTGQWYHAEYSTSSATQHYGFQLNYTRSEPPGRYAVDVEYGWYVQGIWRTTTKPIMIYQQYGTTVGVNGMPTSSCLA